MFVQCFKKTPEESKMDFGGRSNLQWDFSLYFIIFYSFLCLACHSPLPWFFYVLLLGVKTMHKILSNTLQSSKLRFFSLLYADHFDDVIFKKICHLFQPISSAIFIIFPFNFHLLYLACILLYSTFFSKYICVVK